MNNPPDKLDRLLKASVDRIETPPGFERDFWEKVRQRQQAPRLVRLLDNIAFWIPVPSLPQAVAATLVAFMVGTAGGAVSGFGSLRSSMQTVEQASISLPSISSSVLQ